MSLLLLWTGAVQAQGVLVPSDQSLPPLAMIDHKVSVTIEDQVAVTTVEQTFRNHTDRDLEATYIFPVPKGASVSKFTMWVDGKEIERRAGRGRQGPQIYTDIVRRTQDPGLLEYIGNNLLRMRVFPVPPQGRPEGRRQLHLRRDARTATLVEYVYPLKTDGKATQHARRSSRSTPPSSRSTPSRTSTARRTPSP